MLYKIGRAVAWGVPAFFRCRFKGHGVRASTRDSAFIVSLGMHIIIFGGTPTKLWLSTNPLSWRIFDENNSHS